MNTFKIIDGGVERNPIVSVALLTYNHGEFITQAIESALIQKDVPCEIVIADDASTDDTRNIILGYQKKYPQRIKLILQDQNIGAHKNEIVLLTNLSGKYIAFLEGDDYWTDPLKLQKQVDFLEKNKDFSSCFHNVKILKNDKLKDDDLAEVNSVTTIHDLAQIIYIRTCSYMFRNGLIKEFPKDYEDVSGADYFLFMLIAKHGKIKKLPGAMAVYRRHDKGIWSPKTPVERFKTMLKDLELMIPFFDNDVSQGLRERHAKIVFQFAVYLADHKLENEAYGFVSNSIAFNIDVILKKMATLIHENDAFNERQKSLKYSFKNTLNLTKTRLTQYFRK